jgi:F420-non-reducing hydrogenase iron-sulfur subunit
MSDFEPRIVGFLCNWCSYAGADLAGVSRFQYPPNLRIIRVMCSGRVHPAHIMEAFKDGADGVLVAGCHPPNDCHYISGNLKAKRRVAMLKQVLKQL